MKDVVGADVVFFKGWSIYGERASDEVCLDVDDDYKELKDKVNAIHRWALQRGYEYLWKVDDDVYLRPERLLALNLSTTAVLSQSTKGKRSHPPMGITSEPSMLLRLRHQSQHVSGGCVGYPNVPWK